MNIFAIIGIIIAAVAGWLACQLPRDRRLDTAMSVIRRDVEFERLLVQQLQDRSASSTASQRRVLRLIEEGRPEQARTLLASAIAAYYQSWKGNTEQRLTSAIERELAAIERDAESLPSIRTELQHRYGGPKG